MAEVKRIGLLSDTHGWLDPSLLPILEGCDEIWHAGDWGSYGVYEELLGLGKVLRGVSGNIDGWDLRRVLPEDQVFVCCGRVVWLTHIGGTPPGYTPRILSGLSRRRIDVLVCGHTHVVLAYRDRARNLLYLNPGAAGKYGPHKMRTAMVLEWEEGCDPRVQVVELGPRTG